MGKNHFFTVRPGTILYLGNKKGVEKILLFSK
jgi:hypothetical protein